MNSKETHADRDELITILYQQCRKEGYIRAYRLLRHREDSLDAVSEAFRKICALPGEFHSEEEFKRRFYKILRNVCLNVLRKKQNLCFVSLEEREWLREKITSRNDLDPRQILDKKDLARKMKEAIQSLDVNQREAVIMKYQNKSSTKQIAATMECPEGTVKWWLYTARERLKKELGYYAGEKGIAEEREQ